VVYPRIGGRSSWARGFHAEGLGGVDAEIKELLIGVAKAGPWAAWNGAFETSWIKLLCLVYYARLGSATGERES
jgi:hypothetical protein